MSDIYNYDLTVDTSPQYDLDVNNNDNIDLEVKDNVIIITRETYTYHQNIPASQWEIHHDMGRHPSVTIVDSAGTQVIGEVQYISNNVLIISFLGSFAGTAYLN